MKEFEKLLQDAKYRAINEKALNMVRLGLFEEKEIKVSDMSFEKLEEITVSKPYKRVFHLYKNVETDELLYVNPLTLVGETDAVGNDVAGEAKPYAYQVLLIENVTEEQYQEVLKASQTERSSLIDVAYKAQFVILCISLIVAVIYMVNQIVSYAGSYGFFLGLYSTLTDGMFVPYLLLGTEIGMYVLTSIFYRKFKNGL